MKKPGFKKEGNAPAMLLMINLIEKQGKSLTDPSEIPADQLDGKIEFVVNRNAQDSGTGKATSTTISSIKDVSLDVDATMNIW